MAKLYALKRDNLNFKSDGWKVVLIRTGKVYFYGSHSECVEWMERNEGDEHN